MNLTTTARAKAMITVGGGNLSSDADTVLGRMVEMWSKKAEDVMDRRVTTATWTEYLDVDGGQQVFPLKAFPITTMSAVYHDISREFTSSAIDSDNYSTMTGSGLLRVDGYALARAPGSLKVVYLGGMASTTTAFIAAYPEIAFALDMQVAHAWQRKDQIGGTSYESPAGGAAWTGEVDWLKDVKQTLMSFKRY